MSIEKITSKIISDAESIAKVTLDEANAECDAILARADSKAEQILREAGERGQDEKEKLISRRKAVADIDGRKIILEEKQKLIAECFDQAIDQITSMKKEEYIAFLAGLVKKTGETEGELILNQKDAASVGTDLVNTLSKELAGSKITLSKETKNIRGGFLLKKGSIFINGTVEALVDEAKEDLVGEVAAQLFQ